MSEWIPGAFWNSPSAAFGLPDIPRTLSAPEGANHALGATRFIQHSYSVNDSRAAFTRQNGPGAPRKSLKGDMALAFHGGNTGSNPVGDAKVAFSSDKITQEIGKMSCLSRLQNPGGKRIFETSSARFKSSIATRRID